MCDCCWQVGEQRKTGNERNHLLTLKITNWKVLGPGVNSRWLLQMTEWEFSKERTYLKEFSKIWFWCHGKTLILKWFFRLLDVPSRRHTLAKNYNMSSVVQSPCIVHALRIFWKIKEKNKKGKEVFTIQPSNARSSNRCFHKHHVICMLQQTCEFELPHYKWKNKNKK